MARELSIPLQTIYAELLDRCFAAELEDASAESGTFVSKQVRGRRYWYLQQGPEEKQTYIGPESEELLQRIETWRQRRSQSRERRQLVAALRRAGLPGPDRATGEALAALAAGGVFRLRALLVGTLAFQTYGPLVGLRLPGASLRTGDIDIAQLHEVSLAIDDAADPPIELLKRADPSFRAAPSLNRKATAFASGRGVRVEFLAPKRRSEDRVWLKALRTHAQPLPYLEYLLHEPVRAVVLTGAGVPVQVPEPARYACHKLVIGPLRQTNAKKAKDLHQASLLVEHLLEADAAHLGETFAAFAAGSRNRRKLLVSGMERLAPPLRAGLLALPELEGLA